MILCWREILRCKMIRTSPIGQTPNPQEKANDENNPPKTATRKRIGVIFCLENAQVVSNTPNIVI